jgi:hypothetical protein
MIFHKSHLEFQMLDIRSGWATPPGYPSGKQKILASDLDETSKIGSRSRLLRFDPGVFSTTPFVQDHWEEAFLLSDDLIVGNDDEGRGNEHSRPTPMRAGRAAHITGRSSPRKDACRLRSTITTTASARLHPYRTSFPV